MEVEVEVEGEVEGEVEVVDTWSSSAATQSTCAAHASRQRRTCGWVSVSVGFRLGSGLVFLRHGSGARSEGRPG